MTTEITTDPGMGSEEGSAAPSADLVLSDYRTAVVSRELSVTGRAEVLAGRAQFSIGGSGKEVAQLALARFVKPGDYRSGYYRDQTLLLALDATTPSDMLRHLYADLDSSTGIANRQMPSHWGNRHLDDDGNWLQLVDKINTSSDLSPVAAQMPRLVGLGYASTLYRQRSAKGASGLPFSRNGDEIAFGTIGNASCAEGMFWESINSIGTIQCPVVLSIWDDDYGISVSNEIQHTKGDLGELLSGFAYDAAKESGLRIHQVKGWDYEALVRTYELATEEARSLHLPSVVHVTEMTQPLGHSTSGSHERYKSPERMQFESDFDCNKIFRKWILDQGLATEEALQKIENESVELVKEAQQSVYAEFAVRNQPDREALRLLLQALIPESGLIDKLTALKVPHMNELVSISLEALIESADQPVETRAGLVEWHQTMSAKMREDYTSHVYSEGADSALAIEAVAPSFSDESPSLPGHKILNENFVAQFRQRPEVVTFGQDTGNIGGVNQAMANMQELFGEDRVTDAGIRETTIIGLAIGLAQRGFRPVAEIQYLDYLLYCLQLMSDDLATLRWRTVGGQKAPVVIRTRGHRFVGIWHAGSPMAGILNLVRGIRVCVPRNMTAASGMYNTLLDAGEPALVVEPLEGYRLREVRPDNLDQTRVPLGVPEVLNEGSDVTIVTYGACVRISLETVPLLEASGISAEVIDVQTLLPFDIDGVIRESLEKTNKIVFFDEDVPGGTTAYMMQQVLQEQDGFDLLDAQPVLVCAAESRPAYGPDGIAFTRPGVPELFTAVSEMMENFDPSRYRDVSAK